MAAMNWPYHLKVTRKDGTVHEDDFSEDYDAVGYARFASTKPNVERVELSVAFVAGEAVPVQATAATA